MSDLAVSNSPTAWRNADEEANTSYPYSKESSVFYACKWFSCWSTPRLRGLIGRLAPILTLLLLCIYDEI